MEPISPTDVKARIIELPTVAALQSDHRVMVDSPTLRGGNSAPAAVVARANVDIPLSAGNPTVGATLLLLDGGVLKRYTVIAAVGSENVWYLGPFANPPVATNQGLPLTPGFQYFNTTDKQVYVFTGTGQGEGWQPYGVPYPANSMHYYYYFATATQDITGPDNIGNVLSFDVAAGDDIQVFVNGAKLLYNVDFTLPNGSTIHTGGVLCANSVCEVIVQKRVTIDFSVTPFAVNTDLWVFDGVQRVFAMQKMGGGFLTPGSSLNTLLSLNGRLLDPSREYTTLGSDVILVAPPAPGTVAWMTVGLPVIPDYILNAVTLASQEGTNDLSGMFLDDGNGVPVTFEGDGLDTL